MSDSESLSGIGVGGLLGVVFVTLKLCGVIAWSWWWVMAPFWGGIAIFVAVFVIILVGIKIWDGITAICAAIRK